MLDTVIKPIAAQSLAVTFSLNTSNAISVVVTISKFPNSEAFDADPIRIPSIRNIGAAISNTIIPMVYGKSFLVSLSDLSSSFT